MKREENEVMCMKNTAFLCCNASIHFVVNYQVGFHVCFQAYFMLKATIPQGSPPPI